MARETFWSTYHIPPRARIAIFLGRLHPVKGLPRLVKAWGAIQKSEVRGQRSNGLSNWHLVLAGPDEGSHRSELASLVSGFGCGQSVLFVGQLDDHQKWGALAAADLFIMPSDFENFGNAIVEAMSSGLPVVTTTGTPWHELPANGMGWCVPPTVDDLTDALRDALTMQPAERQAMGRRAADFAKRFRPEQIATDLIQVYEWLLGRGDRPKCVVS